MTTPLSLKSFEISNKIYSYILPYQGFTHLNAITKQFETANSRRSFNYYYLYTFGAVCMMLCSADIIYEMSVSETLPYSLSYLSLSVFLLVEQTSGIVLLFIFLPNSYIFYRQFLNNLLVYEGNLLPIKSRREFQQTVIMLIKIRKLICIFYIVTFGALILQNIYIYFRSI